MGKIPDALRAGIGNHAIPDSQNIFLFGFSGYDADFFNVGTAVSGLFDLSRLP
jgi:hypothetical protein